jgi:hypothetical protein
MTDRPIPSFVSASAASSEPRISGRETLLVLVCCTVASLAAILWSWRNGAMLNYGDAVAHLHIARRVFDAHQPRLDLLGSVWLPLPHIFLLPFVQVYSWWANGIAGVIPSALAYLAACVGIYRLARIWLPTSAAALTLAFYALNPNLLYLQTTAMTEPLFLCEMVWTTLWLVEWHANIDGDPASTNRRQALIAIALIAAVYTRYDGWIMAFLAWTAMGIVLLRRGRLLSRAFWIASAFVVAAPIAWFIYNQLAFGDWLDFARGPYSARAIEIRTATPGYPPHPGWHNPWVSFLFFIKCAELDAAALASGTWLLVLSLAGAAWAAINPRFRNVARTLLLFLPIPFYAYSIAWGSVPIFMPVWWPHSWYNLRYGMELLPAFALCLGFTAHFVFDLFGPRPYKPRVFYCVATILFAAVGFNAYRMLRECPLVYVEGSKNIHARRPIYSQIPPVLHAYLTTHPNAVILMDTSTYPEIVSLTGIPLRQTINESDLKIYTSALAAPATSADLVLAFDGDAIDAAVKANHYGLTAIHRFTAPNQPSATLYVPTKSPSFE